MPDSLNVVAPEPYARGASELRAVNAALLAAVDLRLGTDRAPEREQEALQALQPAVREFLARGSATGAYVEDVQERTACQALLDYWTSSLAHAGVLLPRARLAPFDAARLPALPDEACPYAGLDAFEAAGRRAFFGRERAAAELRACIAATPLAVVVGGPGSGKSSLVRSGVLPVLAAPEHDPRFTVVGPFAPGNEPLDRLAQAVVEAVPALAPQAATLAADLHADPGRLVASLAGAGPLLLVIDPFDDVFTLSGEADPQPEALAAVISALLQSRPADRVVLTLSEELSAQLESLVPLRPLLDGARFPMSAWPMSFDDLKGAIEGPAALVNLHFEPGLVDDIVKGVMTAGDTALPLLQFTLRELWRQRDGNPITWATYRKIGGSPKAAHERHAERVYGTLSDDEKREFERILRALVRVDRLLETRRHQELRSRLLATGGEHTAGVLVQMERDRFIRMTPSAGGDDAVVEIRHEALLRNWPRYVGWIEEKREHVRRRIAVTEAAQRWVQGGRSRTRGLLTAWQIEEAHAIGDLTGVAAEFVEASARAVRRHARWRVARFMLGTAVAMLAVWAGIERQSARHEGEAQQLREKMAAARAAAIDGRLGRAFTGAVVAAQAAQQAGTDVEDRKLRFDALATLLALHGKTSDVQRLYVDPGAVYRAAAFQPRRDPPLLAFAGSGGVVHLTTPGGQGDERQLQACNGTVTALAFDPAGRRLASGCADGHVKLWSTDDWTPIAGGRTQMFTRTVWALAFSRDGRLLAAGGSENLVRLWAIAEQGVGAPELSDAQGALPEGSVWSLGFDPAADRLLVGDGKGRLLRCSPDAAGAWRCDEVPLSAAAGQLAGEGDGNVVDDAIRAVAFSPDGARVAVGHWRGDVQVLGRDLSAARASSLAVGSTVGPIFSVAFFTYCGAEYLAIAKGAGLQYRRITERGAQPAPADCPRLERASIGDDVHHVAAGGGALLAAATQSGYVAVLDPARITDRVRTTLNVATRESEQTRGAILAGSAGSARIAVAVHPVGPDRPSVQVLSLERRGETIVEIGRSGQLFGEGYVRRLAASAETGRLATLAWMQPDDKKSRGEVVKLWRFDAAGQIDPAPLRSMSVAEFGGQVPCRIALSPDGRWLVVAFDAGDRGRLALIDDAGALQWTPSGLARVREIAFSADGKHFAAGGDRRDAPAAEGEVRVWRVSPDGLQSVDTAPMRLTSLARLVQEVAFVREGRRHWLPLLFGEQRVDEVVAAGEYGEIDAWSLPSGASLDPRRVDSRPVWLLAFTVEGGRAMLAAADSVSQVRLWDTDRRETEPIQLSRPEDRGGQPGMLLFGDGGSWLVSGSWRRENESELQIWDLDLRSLQRKACALLRFPRADGEVAARTGVAADCPPT